MSSNYDQKKSAYIRWRKKVYHSSNYTKVIIKSEMKLRNIRILPTKFSMFLRGVGCVI